MSEEQSIKTVLIQELTMSFDMILMAINNMDDTNWDSEQNEWSYVTTLYHIIHSIEFFAYNGTEAMFLHGSVSGLVTGLSKEDAKNQIRIKKKEFFLNYLERVKKLVFDILSTYQDHNLIEQDNFAEWGMSCRLQKFIYTLRHSMFHIGELNKNLRDLQKPRIKWL